MGQTLTQGTEARTRFVAYPLRAPCLCVKLNADVDFLFIEPVEDEPFDGEDNGAGHEQLVVVAEERVKLGTEMELDGIFDEAVGAVSQDVGGDRVGADDA